MNILRVLAIAIFTSCLSLNPAFSQASAINSNTNEVPSYRDGILTLPRVDTDEQPGLFQNGIFQFDSTINAWRLQSFETTPTPSIFITSEDGVETIMTNTTPVQIFLKVKGSFIDGCYEVGKVDQRLLTNHFEIVIHVNSTIPRDGSVACNAALSSFEKIVPLQVYELPAGTYEYRVNGEKTGTFALTQDNHL